MWTTLYNLLFDKFPHASSWIPANLLLDPLDSFRIPN